MTANELRIGNYVYYNDKVISIAPHAINEFYYIGDTHSESLVDRRCYEPIELTEEILLKCGFILLDKNYDIQDFNVYKLGDFTYNTSHNVFWFNNIYSFNQPKYLHQLQNLYFALTGYELEIQL